AVFAATQSHAFLWRSAPDGTAVAVNHDAATRPRRQDREPEYRETGAFYVMRTAGFLENRHRFHGRVEVAVVDGAGAIDIDDEADLALAETLAEAPGALTDAPVGAPAPAPTTTRDPSPTRATPAPNGAP
ncbi:hypothetical protein Q3H92_20065, partial [Curtobacterium flaccumfaciens]|nr:hypothetical protein [Curtobacterium flaccumfaciens]